MPSFGLPRPEFKKVFYGWWMVLAASGLQLLNAGLLQQSFGAYVVVLRNQFGWSKTELAGVYSMQQIEQGVLGPFQGWFVDRFGPRVLLRIGVVSSCVGFLLLSRVETLPMLYGTMAIIAFGASMSGFFPLTVALVNWFEKRRAKALSTMSVGFALGGVVVPIVAYSLEHFGFRSTSVGAGIIVLVVGMPLTQFIRWRPEHHGEVVDGIRDPVDSAGVTIKPQGDGTRDFTFHEAVRTPAFWLISGGHGSALLIVSAVNVHIVSHMEDDLGYTLGNAAAIVTLMTVMQVIGMIIGGVLGDKGDNSGLATLCMGMHMTGLLLVAYAINLPMVLAFAVLHGLAWGIRGPLMQAIRADYFGRTHFGTIMGFSSLIIMLGNITGPLVAGILADATGNYKLGFTVLAILSGMGSIFFIAAKKPPRPLAGPVEEYDRVGAAG